MAFPGAGFTDPKSSPPTIDRDAPHPAQIRQIRAGIALRGVTTPVPRVLLSTTLTGPTPSGSADAPRLCRGCSHPPRHLPDQAAPSYARPLRRPDDDGLSPPLEQQRLTAHEAGTQRLRDHLRRPYRRLNHQLAAMINYTDHRTVPRLAGSSGRSAGPTARNASAAAVSRVITPNRCAVPFSTTLRSTKPASAQASARRAYPPAAAAYRGLWSAGAAARSDGRSNPPVSSNRNSRPSDGARMIPPASTATITAIRVSRDAAASCRVSPGSTVGRWAAAQPAMIGATATAAPRNGAGSHRWSANGPVAADLDTRGSGLGRDQFEPT